MQIDTAGTYTLKYTAEDNCGNVTEVTREVVAEKIEYRTVLYADGTFIINEKSTDRDVNIALHGAVTNEYSPWNPNGQDLYSDLYEFAGENNRAWDGQRSLIKYVEFGSLVKPTRLDYWFFSCNNLETIDSTNLDTSDTNRMYMTFDYDAKLTGLDLSSWNTSKVTSMKQMFYYCTNLVTLDISGFSAEALEEVGYMFNRCDNLETIYASPSFDLSAKTLTDGSAMFIGLSRKLVGGAGTVWNAGSTSKTYARIDGGTSNPGYFTAKSA